LDDRRRDGGTDFILRIKKQETRLILQELHPGGIRTHSLSRRAAAEPRLCGRWDRQREGLSRCCKKFSLYRAVNALRLCYENQALNAA